MLHQDTQLGGYELQLRELASYPPSGRATPRNYSTVGAVGGAIRQVGTITPGQQVTERGLDLMGANTPHWHDL